jgi:hypothetical protein
VAQPVAAAGTAFLFKPTIAWRVRWNTSTDMPWPVEEPVGQNPPDGVGINYYLKAAASKVTLEVLRADGRVIRRYTSDDPLTAIPDPPAAPVPIYWYRPPQKLSSAPGVHRFIWDVHYQPLPAVPGGEGGAGGRGGLPIQAIPYNSAPAPTTPWVTPGRYTVKLTVDGRSYEQPIDVRQDPRVKTPDLVMKYVYAQTDALYFGAIDAQEAAVTLAELRQKAAKAREGANGPRADALDAFIKKAQALEGSAPAAGGGRGRGGAPAPPAAADTLWAARAALAALMNSMQAADVAPTANTRAAVAAARGNAQRVMLSYRLLQKEALTLLK